MSLDFVSDQPGMLKAMMTGPKWQSWSSKKGMSQEDAKTRYVAKVEELVAKYGTK